MFAVAAVLRLNRWFVMAFAGTAAALFHACPPVCAKAAQQQRLNGKEQQESR